MQDDNPVNGREVRLRRKASVAFLMLVVISGLRALLGYLEYGEPALRTQVDTPWFILLLSVLSFVWLALDVWRVATTPWKDVILAFFVLDTAYDAWNIFSGRLTYYGLWTVIGGLLWVYGLFVLYYHHPAVQQVPPQEVLPEPPSDEA